MKKNTKKKTNITPTKGKKSKMVICLILSILMMISVVTPLLYAFV